MFGSEDNIILLCKKQSLTDFITRIHSNDGAKRISSSTISIVHRGDDSGVSNVGTAMGAANVTMPAFQLKDLTVTLLVTESCADVLNLHLPQANSSADSDYQSQASSNDFGSPDAVHYSPEDTIPEIAYMRDVDLEDSSCSVANYDDLSQLDLINRKCQNEMLDDASLTYIKPFIVFFTPMQIVNASAHKTNLRSNSQNLFVTVVKSDDTTTSESSWVNVCRICYDGDSIEQLVGPCRCRGSVALAHYSCLERWLRESCRSRCELCLHRYQIIREPRYNVMTSILVWLFSPGDHTFELVKDFLGFCIYTPTALMSTYLLLLSCETIKQTFQTKKTIAANLMAFIAISGMAAIDFAYSTWLMMRIKRHVQSWRSWWLNNCHFTLILPARKLASSPIVQDLIED